MSSPRSPPRYTVFAMSGASGVKVSSLAVAPLGRAKLPSTDGVIRNAAAAAATSTGWSKVTRNALRTSTTLPSTFVATIRPAVWVRVTNATRVGEPSWRPLVSAAAAPIVIV